MYSSLCVFAGLRTLCFAVVDISESSYQQWLEIYHRASTSLQNRALKMEESYELIEKVRHTNSFSSVHRLSGLRTKVTEPSRTLYVLLAAEILSQRNFLSFLISYFIVHRYNMVLHKQVPKCFMVLPST